MAIKTAANCKCWRECGSNGTLLHCWWECKLAHPLWRCLKKLKIWSISPTPWHISGDKHYLKRCMHSNFHWSIFTICTTKSLFCTPGCLSYPEPPKYLWMNEWIKMGYISTICIKMDGSKDYHSKLDNYVISFICGILKKKNTNELIYKTEKDSHSRKTNLQLTYAYQRVVGGGIN